LVPPAVAHQCRQVRGDLPLVMLEHCGHCPHDEDPPGFHGALLGWLARL
jgi:pimeloyl-ACP methyl ester carboxylesterase